VTPVNYGEWQHVAFFTTGSFWQVYVDGVAQFETLPNFICGSPSGSATVGADNDIALPFQGLIDEHRVFTWTGAFNPADLLGFSLRDDAGDVNEDGMVDTLDYDIWRANIDADLDGLSLEEGRMLGDLDGNRLINLEDFGIIKDNKSPGVVFGVPEPSGCLLLLTGLLSSVGLMGRRSASASMKHQRTVTHVAIVATLLAVSQPSHLFAQATWGGGDGNWNDANWSGGSGAGGTPGNGDTVVLPGSTGILAVTNDIGVQFNLLQHQGGILLIEPAGALEFTGLVQNGHDANDASSELHLGGELVIGGGFDVGRNAAAKVRIDGSARLRVAGNMDTRFG